MITVSYDLHDQINETLMVLQSDSLQTILVEVAVFAPLRTTFDYLFECGGPQGVVERGHRVRVPLKNSERVGIVLSTRVLDERVDRRLKKIIEIIDDKPVIADKMLVLATWASSYYQHPIGEVISLILPGLLRTTAKIPSFKTNVWSISPLGLKACEEELVKGSRQQEILHRLVSAPMAGHEALNSLQFAWRAPLEKLVEKGWVVKTLNTPLQKEEPPIQKSEVILNSEQINAVSIIEANLEKFRPIVLYGITGSGKTEVYFSVMHKVLAAGKQVLFLVPEIALTKHLISRFRERFGSRVTLLHSARSKMERVRAWDDSASGKAGILLGTRSAVWFDLPKLGAIFVDEEHDGAYKQQDGFKYSARDIAIVRAQRNQIPVVLGSATPSFETLANIKHGKYDLAKLIKRPLAPTKTKIEALDMRGLSLQGGLSLLLIDRMRRHLLLGQQVVLFLNRRGYSPLLICRECGEIRSCYRCDAYLVYYKKRSILRCHHCDYKISLDRVPVCCEGQNMAPIGLGTESIEEEVTQLFPGKNIARVDRDTIKSGDSFEIILRDIETKKIDILIGTQMISKGLDFENVTLVGVVDADSRLYSIDFRAEERLAQLLVQVAGRAGRGKKAGEMVLQTHNPDNPVLQRIITDGYDAYANVALEERKIAGLPPFISMVIIRAESQYVARPNNFLSRVKMLLEKNSIDAIKITNPIPAVISQRSGRHRALLVLRLMKRSDVRALISPAIKDIEILARKIKLRWSIDVDPHDTL